MGLEERITEAFLLRNIHQCTVLFGVVYATFTVHKKL